VISDHGVVDVHHNLDLRAPLAAKGLAIDRDQAMYVWQSDLTDDVTTRYAEFDGTLHVNGNTMNFLYFREPGHPRDAGFGARLTYDQLRAYPTQQGSSVDLIATLAQVEGVEWVVALARLASGPSVVVTTASGQGIVRKQGTSYAYQASGVDPLGYSTDPGIAHLTDGNFYPDETWLTATHRSAFPDALNRLHALLTSPGCGDVVVTAKAGYDLAEQFEWLVGNYQGGHGGIRADQLRVPYVLAGPGLRSGVVVPVARAEDVGATLGHLMGLQRPQGLSGRVLSQALIPSAP
jgi:hypothetical protein